MSLTNGLINWLKVNGDVEIIQDGRSLLKYPKKLDTYFKNPDNRTVRDTERRRIRNQTKAPVDYHEQLTTIKGSIDAWLKTTHETVTKMREKIAFLQLIFAAQSKKNSNFL